MTEAEDIQADVLEAVVQYGRTATLTTFANSYDPATGTNTATATAHTVTCTAPYQRKRALQGDTQPRAEFLSTLPAEGLDFVPEPGAKLFTGGVTWTVTSVQPFELQDSTLAYELRLSQGGVA